MTEKRNRSGRPERYLSISRPAANSHDPEYIYFNGRRIARRDASGTVYYFITDHIGNVRVVANASGGVVEESDYLPFGTENVITDTIANNYKFIGMERDFEGTAALDHTLYRQYAPNLARWTTPDPVHGSPANPQTWNRYPYVINDPMTKIDPLGGSHQDYDPYFVGCFPDPFFESLFGGFGCGYSADSKCPPGFEEIYGTPRPDRDGGPAIETINSVHQYANAILPGLSEYGIGFELTPAGVNITIPGEIWQIMLANGFNPAIGQVIRQVGPRLWHYIVLLTAAYIEQIVEFAKAIWDSLKGRMICTFESEFKDSDVDPVYKICRYDCPDETKPTLTALARFSCPKFAVFQRNPGN